MAMRNPTICELVRSVTAFDGDRIYLPRT